MTEPPSGWVSNKDLERELRSFRWEVRFLICVALVLSNVVPVTPADIANALPLPF